MLGQCAPSAVTYDGNDACGRCRNPKGRPRYRSCRVVFDAEGKAIANNACMACHSTNHGNGCTFYVPDARKQGTADEDGQGEEEEQDEYIFDLEQYHHLSTVNKFDLRVQVTSALPMVDMWTQEVEELPVGMEMRIGVRLPGTGKHDAQFRFKREGY